MCAALYVIVFSSLKAIYCWQEENLDIVFFLRDELYKSSNTQQCFRATVSLNIISVCNMQVQTSHLRNKYGMLLKNEGSENYLTHCLSCHSREGISILFTEYCIAAILCDRNTVFLFDSYSPNRLGNRILKRTLINQISRFSSYC